MDRALHISFHSTVHDILSELFSAFRNICHFYKFFTLAHFNMTSERSKRRGVSVVVSFYYKTPVYSVVFLPFSYWR